ncbi:family 20 glycosylhydrolase [Opitutus sp. GAS368]|uniref:family 20 glycosylhydrolase n=1 Tax=Opitutus sp. GAS368 TaxID=1882749 RepID=UPI000879A494|nr:family 20 glycosylhydrolase [Opitutus sp. GAS368]SDR88283.1 Glycosyl hydrolase family 20, catalytic domain [Opitutus sp. GAS368]
MQSTPIKAFQWDLARQVEQLDFLRALLPRYAAWGYQELYLHLEDAVHYPSLPGIGRDDAYTYEQLGELVLAAAQHGIRVVPIVNLLGHTQYLIKHPEWRDLNELRDDRDRPLPHGQICPLHPRTREVAERLLRDLAPYCTAGKVHVGLDESFHLGKCPRCRAEVARLGLGGHFAGHINRLHGVAATQGLQLGIWADMLYFTPEAIPLLPRGITAYDWYYYPFAKKPRVEFFNFAERDLQPALQKHGIAYYGCPMNGAFRHEPLPVFGDRLANIRSWWERCTAVKAEGFLVTSWEAYRLALETTTLVDAAAANLWLEPAQDDATAMLARGLERTFKMTAARPSARALLAADEHAFAGYARWQINDRWDVFAGSESLKPYQNEERFFARLLASGLAWPKALAASLAFRHYLARRDVFVRQAAREVFKLRRLGPARPEAGLHLKAMQAAAVEFARDLKTGRLAAQAMWARTRDPQVRGQNEAVIEADETRLTDWRDWLKRVIRNPELVWQATPVCGVWQLQFMVHNFAPAVQKVIVEQQDADGTWRPLAARYTIEFRAQAARPHCRLKREFTVPVPTPDTPLRLAVHGVGQVAISHAVLTDGVRRLTPRNYRAKRILGQPAPQRGLPKIESGPSSPLLPLNFLA